MTKRRARIAAPDPTGEWVVRNGRLRTHAEAAVRISHPGFRIGLGLFETLLAVDGRVVAAAEHVERMRASARWLGLRGTPAAPAVRRGVAELHAAWRSAGASRAALRFLLVRLSLSPASIDARTADWTLTAEPIDAAARARLRRGVACGLSSWRQPSTHPLVAHKTLAYLDRWLTTRDARREGHFDDIRLDDEGCVAEGSLSSVFVVADGVLRAPPTAGGILPGVTATAVLRLARRARLRVRIEPIPAGDLLDAEEIFLTNSTKGVVPVLRLDGRRVGKGRPGPVTRRLQGMLERALTGGA